MIDRALSVALCALAVAALTSACSMTKLAANGTVDVMWEAGDAIGTEDDPELAESGIVGNLKMMEGLMLVVPDNQLLYRLAAEAFSSYAFGFLEPRLWKLSEASQEHADLTAKAKRMYVRALRYAKKRVELLAEDAHKAIASGKLPAIKKALTADFDEEQVDALFWLAQTWGQLIALDSDDLNNVGDLEIARVIMMRVAKSSPGHEDGAVHVFFGTGMAAMGPGLAGDMKGAAEHYERGIKVTDGKYLLPLYMKGRFYCEAINDRKCFEESLGQVLAADVNAHPKRRLTNILVQQWSKHWLSKAGDLF